LRDLCSSTIAISGDVAFFPAGCGDLGLSVETERPPWCFAAAAVRCASENRDGIRLQSVSFSRSSSCFHDAGNFSLAPCRGHSAAHLELADISAGAAANAATLRPNLELGLLQRFGDRSRCVPFIVHSCFPQRKAQALQPRGLPIIFAVVSG